MITFFAQHRTAANPLMLVFLILGVLALPQLQRETFPEFDPPTIRIFVSYPGAATELVDSLVVQRIEDEIAGLQGVASIQSQARERSASTTIDVEDRADFDALLAKLKSAIDGIRDFPSEIDPPTVRAQSRMPSVASIAVTGPMSEQELKLYCEQLKRELLRNGEVSQVSVSGFSTHRPLNRVNRAALVREGLRVADVASAVSAARLDAPLGTIEARDGEIVVRYSDRRTTPEQLAAIIVKGSSGRDRRAHRPDVAGDPFRAFGSACRQPGRSISDPSASSPALVAFAPRAVIRTIPHVVRDQLAAIPREASRSRRRLDD